MWGAVYHHQMLSVIIPSLNAEKTLAATVGALKTDAGADLIADIVLVDGGSTDDTLALAAELGLRTIHSQKGRGHQLAQGAVVSHAPWLLFLHADTQLEPGWGEALREFMIEAPAQDIGRAAAAVFKFALDDDSPQARRLERAVDWRTRVLRLPYGDQGLFISKQKYLSVGGFKPLALMEDVDIVRRIGRRNIHQLPIRAITSAEKFQQNGYFFQSSRNLLCLGLFFAGAPISFIQKIYG